eukprot:6201114-Amphidinium_carterae.1
MFVGECTSDNTSLSPRRFQTPPTCRTSSSQWASDRNAPDLKLHQQSKDAFSNTHRETHLYCDSSKHVTLSGAGEATHSRSQLLMTLLHWTHARHPSNGNMRQLLIV